MDITRDHITDADIEHISLFVDPKRAKWLGTGGFGKVYRVSSLGGTVAIKVFGRNSDFKTELDMMKTVAARKHPSIVVIHGHSVFRTNQKQFIVFECAQCSLYALLHENIKDQILNYTIGNSLSWCKQITDGMNYLHHFNQPKPIMHRDLKPQNVLMFNEFQTVKITDFGLARFDASSVSKSIKGTPGFRAPEIGLFDNNYNIACDVFSAGVTFWEIFNRRKIRSVEDMFEDKNDKVIKRLYERCMSIKPIMRPKMQDVFDEFSEMLRVCLEKANHLVSHDLVPGKERLPPTFVDEFLTLWRERPGSTSVEHQQRTELKRSEDLPDIAEVIETQHQTSSEYTMRADETTAQSHRIVVFHGDSLSWTKSSDMNGKLEWIEEEFKLPNCRYGGAAVGLADKRVLLIAGKRGTNFRARDFLTSADVVQLKDWLLESQTVIAASAPTAITINQVPLVNRYNCDAAAVDSGVIIAGGQDQMCDPLQSAEMFNVSEGKSASLPDMQQARSGLAMAIGQSGQVFATGGLPATNAVECFDLAKTCWLAGPSMVNNRSRHAAASLGSRIYVSGGASDGNSVETIDCREQFWRPCTSMIYCRQWHRLLAVDQRLLALGGYHDWNALASVEVFDERNAQWRELTPMAKGRWSFHVVAA